MLIDMESVLRPFADAADKQDAYMREVGLDPSEKGDGDYGPCVTMGALRAAREAHLAYVAGMAALGRVRAARADSQPATF